MYAPVKYYLVVSLSSLKNLKSCILKSTMGAVHLSNGLSTLSMKFSENFKFNPNNVSIHLPKTISYLISKDSSTWNPQVTMFFALKHCRHNVFLFLISFNVNFLSLEFCHSIIKN